jgi:ribosomal protein S6--L-glutamate ligase
MKRPHGVWKAQRVFTESSSAAMALEFSLPTTHKASERLLIGRHEWIGLPEFGSQPWVAKTDSGARTSTLHATEITVSADGQTVRFTTTCSDQSTLVCEAPIVRCKIIRSSAGIAEQRVIVATTAIFAGGLSFPIELTLADRSNMKCPVLLGRRAMAGYFLIDPQSDYLLGNQNDFFQTALPSS